MQPTCQNQFILLLQLIKTAKNKELCVFITILLLNLFSDDYQRNKGYSVSKNNFKLPSFETEFNNLCSGEKRDLLYRY